jgi:cytochrome b subunit of formate dehydrogenase
MMFFRGNTYSSKVKTMHQERCGHICACLAVFLLALSGAMLFLAINAQFSEQKTTFYIIFALSLIGVGVLVGVTIFLIRNAAKKRDSQRAYQLNYLTSKRMAAAFNQQQIYDTEFQREIQMQIQNSISEQLNDSRRYEQY